jgi:aspartate racemase
MKVIGLLGGMTWHSSIEYYRIINQLIAERLGGYHSGHLILYSFDFAPIDSAQYENRWDDAAKMLTDAAKSLKQAGADFLIICANTMHKVADEVEKGSGIPLIHIANATGEAIKNQGLKRIGLLGTIFTMKEDFYKLRLRDNFALEVITPEEKDLNTIDDIIRDELGQGLIKESSKQIYIDIIHKLMDKGAEGIILGCTEIPLLIKPEDVNVPLFNTTQLHAEAAVNMALS